MEHVRIAWEPENRVSFAFLEERIKEYSNGRFSFSILRNGTLLFLKDNSDLNTKVNKSMELARFITDFSVDVMEKGDYLVHFKGPIYSYVGKEEFENQKREIEARVDELTFPGERFLNESEELSKEKVLVGLFARAKMYRDAFNAELVRTVEV